MRSNHHNFLNHLGLWYFEDHQVRFNLAISLKIRIITLMNFDDYSAGLVKNFLSMTYKISPKATIPSPIMLSLGL